MKSGIRLSDGSKLTMNRKKDNDVTICWHDVIVNFFWGYVVSLVTCSYWSKFHVNFITASGVMIIFFHKGLTRNPKIGNSPTWVLPNIWRLGQFRDTKFGTDISKEMLLNGANCQGYRFYHFWVIMGKTTGGEGKITPPPPPPAAHPD